MAAMLYSRCTCRSRQLARRIDVRAPRPARRASATPAMRQYLDAKQQHRDAIVFFRMGDFYEMFYEDALVGRARARADADLAVEGRQRRRRSRCAACRSTPLDGYIARLVRKGFRVAICEQVEDPRKAKGLVKREVVRVVSPGTLTDASYLDAREPAFLMARRAPAGIGAAARSASALLDLSTGEFTAAEYARRRRAAGARRRARRAPAARDRASPADVDVADAAAATAAAAQSRVTTRRRLDVRARSRRGGRCSISCARAALEGFGLDDAPAAVAAAGALVALPARHAEGRPRARPRRSRYRPARRRAAHRPDDAASTSRSSRAPTAAATGSLLDELDRTVTSMGSRLLRAWLLRPLVALERDPRSARRRRGARVPHAPSAASSATRSRPSRTSSGWSRAPRSAPPARAISSALRQSLARRPARRARSLGELQAPLVAQPASPSSTTSPTCATRIERTLVDEPPALARDGGFTRDGVDPELDELRDDQPRRASRSSPRWRSASARAPASRSLKVRYNRVFGYYIEISKSNLHARAGRLPPQADDRRRRALHHAGAEGVRGEGARRRRAHPRARARDLRGAARARSPPRRRASRTRRARWPRSTCSRRSPRPPPSTTTPSRTCTTATSSRPSTRAIRSSSGTCAERVRAQRHHARTATTRQLVILTGPEHGRQVHLPAPDGAALRCWRRPARSCRRASAKLPLVDRIFARVGASDNIARGQSTFMVEMQETANILHTRHVAQPRRPRRDRPRHGDLRRPEHRLGGRRAPRDEPARPPEDALRHALSRADRPGRRAARRRQLPRRRARVEGRHRLPAQDRAGPIRSQLRHPGRAAGRPARRRSSRARREILAALERDELTRGGRPSRQRHRRRAAAAARPVPARRRAASGRRAAAGDSTSIG